MNTTFKVMTIAAGAALAGPAVATADTISFSQTHTNLFGDPLLRAAVQISGDTTPTQGVYAGGFNVTSNNNEDFVAFCIDLAESLNLSVSYETASSPFVASVSDNLSKLFTGYYEDIDTSIEAAAFQVSIWEVITDTVLDLNAGGFQLLSNGVYDNNAVAAEASTYLTGLSAFDADYDMSYFLAAGTQDLVVGTPSPLSPVPLPASSLLLLAGLGALAVGARKRR